MNTAPSDKWAVVLSIIAFIGIAAAFDFLATAFHITMFVDFDSPVEVNRGLYDQEVDGYTTPFGMLRFVVAGMFAWRIYHWVVARKFRDSITRRQTVLWRLWFGGLALYLGAEAIVNALKLPPPLPWFAKLALLGGIWVAGRRWWESWSRNAALCGKGPAD